MRLVTIGLLKRIEDSMVKVVFCSNFRREYFQPSRIIFHANHSKHVHVLVFHLGELFALVVSEDRVDVAKNKAIV